MLNKQRQASSENSKIDQINPFICKSLSSLLPNLYFAQKGTGPGGAETNVVGEDGGAIDVIVAMNGVNAVNYGNSQTRL